LKGDITQDYFDKKEYEHSRNNLVEKDVKDIVINHKKKIANKMQSYKKDIYNKKQYYYEQIKSIQNEFNK
jgi:hypothetical protein